MKHTSLDEMLNGWFVGNFEPTVLKTDQFEAAIKRYKAGSVEKKHHHKVATEITVIVEGKVKMNDKIYERNSIITIAPGESVDFEAITDVITAVVKSPSIKNDKFID